MKRIFDGHNLLMALVRRYIMFFVPLAIITAADIAYADTVIFSDDFIGSTLNSAWQVLPGQGSYTVGAGLRYFNAGPTASTTGWFNPALTLALPFTGTSWEMNTKATYSLHWLVSGSYTGPPVPTPFGSSGAQGPEVLVKFNPVVIDTNYAGSDYVVVERVIDAFYGSNSLSASYGLISNGNLLNPADSNISNNIADGTYWYQIVRDGGTLTMNYSSDGITYLNAFTTTLSDPLNPYNELLLGGNTFSTVGSYTDYEYVTITAPSTVPEPAPWTLLAVGLLSTPVWVCRWRNRVAIDDLEASEPLA